MFCFHFSLQLKLQHLISDEIMIYPGYVPEPGVKYRVLHYGLEFRVGNWSFDKAKWRDTDMVNRCWAKFPDPPEPSTLNDTDKDIMQRDLLSIECMRTINEALRLHHERRKCQDPNSPPSTVNSDTTTTTTTEVVHSRKFGKVDTSYTVKSNKAETNTSRELSEPTQKDGGFSPLGFWIVVLWAVSGLGFLAALLFSFSGHKGKGTRGRQHRNKRKA